MDLTSARAALDRRGKADAGDRSSGRRGTAEWQNDEENVKRTRAVLQTLLEDFYVPEFYDTVTSIELLNEPAGFVGGKMMDVVKQYYYDGYGQVRTCSALLSRIEARLMPAGNRSDTRIRQREIRPPRACSCRASLGVDPAGGDRQLTSPTVQDPRCLPASRELEGLYALAAMGERCARHALCVSPVIVDSS